MSLKISKDKFFYDNFLKNPNKNLSRIKSLLSKLGNPESTLSNIIHIAGTNGKGSTLAFLKSCLIENNYSVNAYVSPHLETINERIIIKGSIIDDESLDQIIRECLIIVGKQKISFCTQTSEKEQDRLYWIMDEGPSPEDKLITKQNLAELLKDIKKLRPHYQQVINLRYFQELSYNEISKEIQAPVNNVKIKLLRAKKLLAEIILCKKLNK